MSTPPPPPRLARALLRFFVPDDAGAAIDGDLHEVYVERRAASGAIAAAFWYWLETLSFAMRFTLDRVARVIRGFIDGDAAPSKLDLKLGARLLAKSPGLALVGGLGMAVAIALGAGVYAMINTYFYPDLPLQEGDRVVSIGKFDPRRDQKEFRVLHDFQIWRRELRGLVDIGAFRDIKRNVAGVTGPGEPIKLAEMTASGFRLARTPALRGRTLVDDDERPGAPPVMVIANDVWRTRFASDPAILGRDVRIGRDIYTIVGVMPEGFAFPVNHHYWVPFRAAGSVVAPGMGPDIDVFGRLAPGVSLEAAQAELSALGKRIAAQSPVDLARQEPRIVPYVDIVINAAADGTNAAFALLRFLIGLLLVVVALNVAVLVYARTVTRSGEIAVRTALGARRTRIVAQLFAEAFVLSALSAATGLGIVAIALRKFDEFINAGGVGGAPFWINPGLSLGAVLYAVALAVLSAVIIGALPALRATGAQLRATMGSLGSNTKARLGPTWTFLIVVQVAIAVTVLPAALFQGGRLAGAAFRSAGFPTNEYLSTQLVLALDADATNDARADSLAAVRTSALATSVLARLATEPNVVGASISSDDPWNGSSTSVEAEGSDAAPMRVRVMTVDTSYFGLLRVPVVAGRMFVAADAAIDPGERPIIVNRSFVDDILGGRNPIGRRVRNRSSDAQVKPWHVVVGVIEDFPLTIQEPGERSRARMFRPGTPGELANGGQLIVRVRAQTPEAFAPTLRSIAASVDPMLQLNATRPLDVTYRDYTAVASRIALVIALVTGSVLLLSAAGIHALMAFTVNQRRREIGIRAALGAPARRILAGVLTRASRQLALGIGIGLTAAVGLDQLTGGAMLNGTGLALVPATALFMLVVGLVAAAGPARRGLAVQPTDALRTE